MHWMSCIPMYRGVESLRRNVKSIKVTHSPSKYKLGENIFILMVTLNVFKLIVWNSKGTSELYQLIFYHDPISNEKDRKHDWDEVLKSAGIIKYSVIWSILISGQEQVLDWSAMMLC